MMLVRLPYDHFGDFRTAIDGARTVEIWTADNDYVTASLVEKIAQRPFRENTLIGLST